LGGYFTPLNETSLVELSTGEKIDGFTEADLKALELLGFPRFELESKNAIKFTYGCDYHHQLLRHRISEYYSYLADKDRRYLRHKECSAKELAKRGFTYEFYEKMVIDVIEFFKKIKESENRLNFIKSDLMSAGREDSRLKNLANRI